VGRQKRILERRRHALQRIQPDVVRAREGREGQAAQRDADAGADGQAVKRPSSVPADPRAEPDRGHHAAHGHQRHSQRGHDGCAGREVPAEGPGQPRHAGGAADGPADHEPARRRRGQAGPDHGRHDQVREDEQHAGDAHGARDHEPECQVEDEIPASWVAHRPPERQRGQRSTAEPVHEADGRVERGDAEHVVPRDAQDAPDEQRLDLLAAQRNALERQHGEGGRHRIHDPDQRLLGDGGREQARTVAEARQQRGPGGRKGQGVPVRAVRVRGVAGEQGDGDAEGGHLREGQIHEDDSAREHVQAEPGVDGRQHERGHQRPREHLQHQRASAAASRATFRSKRAR